METKHTKGKWSVNPNHKKVVQSDSEKLIICNCSNEQDSLLISFAPEMLEVLQAVQASKSYNKTDLAIMYNLVDQTLKKIIG